jgi:hypothetical protein
VTEDQANAPRAKPTTPMPLLDRQIADAKYRMTIAATKDLERYYAERVIGLRFERGDFPMIPDLTHTIHKALARAQIKDPTA